MANGKPLARDTRRVTTPAHSLCTDEPTPVRHRPTGGRSHLALNLFPILKLLEGYHECF